MSGPAAPPPNPMACEACGHASSGRIVAAREMMFGLRDSFRYLECSRCGCLSLIDVPADLARYYPPEYFPGATYHAATGLKAWLARQRARYCLERRGLIGKLLVRLRGEPRCSIFGRPAYYGWFRRCQIGFSTRIADVGCGSALLLHRMHLDGFTHLTGIDPFAPASIPSAPGFRIIRDDVFAVSERFGLIMLHHTFEHLSEPLRVLRHLHALLEPGGHLLIRIPVASSHAYRHYGADWVQLDAPRHLFLHTEASIARLAADSGFAVAGVEHDSTDFQFWASEQYRKDIPLKSPQSHAVDPNGGLFSAETIAGYQAQAEELNRRGQGDSACFYLRRD